MVQILPAGRTFGSEFAKGLGGGFGAGFSQAIQSGLENKKRMDLVNSLMGQPQRAPMDKQAMEQQFLQALPQIEQQLGRELQPQDLDQLWSQFTQEQQQLSRGMEEDPLARAKVATALGERDIAGILTEEAKMKEKRRAEKSKQHYEIAAPTLKEAQTIAAGLPQKQAALVNMEEAIATGNLGFFSPDNLAEMTGIEGFRSTEGSVFKTAGKEFFMSNLGRVGARGLNQWLERQLADMQPKIGRSTEANLAVTEILKADNDVARKQVELTNELANRFENELGYVPRDLGSIVEKQLTPYAIDRQMQAKEAIESIKEKYTPSNKEGQLMYDPTGNLRRVPKKDIKDARKAGYREYK